MCYRRLKTKFSIVEECISTRSKNVEDFCFFCCQPVHFCYYITVSKQYRAIICKINVPDGWNNFFLAAQDIFNTFVSWFVENSKSKKFPNTYDAEKILRPQIKNKYPGFNTGLIQAIADMATEAFKSTRGKKPSKKDNSCIRYDERTIKILKNGKTLTFAWMGPRKNTQQIIKIPQWFNLRYPQRRLANAYIGYSAHHKSWVVNLNFEIPEVNSIHYFSNEIEGIDLGVHQLATTDSGEMFSSSKLRAAQRRSLYVTRELQRKGTPSAKRKLKARSGRQRRLTKDINHCISKKIVSNPNKKCFVLENLVKGAPGFSRKSNKILGSWAFRELQTFIEYKARSLGKTVVFVEPHYTSQMCNQCCHISGDNRKKSKFECVECGHQDHADINAARNIKEKYTNPTKSEQPIQAAFSKWRSQEELKKSKKKARQAESHSAQCEVPENSQSFQDVQEDMNSTICKLSNR
jgi:putative transposase